MISKPTVESLREISVFAMRRQGVFDTPCKGTWRWIELNTKADRGCIEYQFTGGAIILEYASTDLDGNMQQTREIIILSKTRPNYGGTRFWFQCNGCGRRAGKLYGGNVFRCRECCGACYQTQLEGRTGRSELKQIRLRQMLGGSGSLDAPFPNKPKWMRWATFNSNRI